MSAQQLSATVQAYDCTHGSTATSNYYTPSHRRFLALIHCCCCAHSAAPTIHVPLSTARSASSLSLIPKRPTKVFLYLFKHRVAPSRSAVASIYLPSFRFSFFFFFKRLTLVKEALIEIGCVVTSLVVGCHARALWPNQTWTWVNFLKPNPQHVVHQPNPTHFHISLVETILFVILSIFQYKAHTQFHLRI